MTTAVNTNITDYGSFTEQAKLTKEQKIQIPGDICIRRESSCTKKFYVCKWKFIYLMKIKSKLMFMFIEYIGNV